MTGHGRRAPLLGGEATTVPRRRGTEGPTDWELAGETRRSTAFGHGLIGLAGATAAATALSIAGESFGALLVMLISVWVSLRSFANAVDVAFDLAWEWPEDGGQPRIPTRSDRAALRLVGLLSDLCDRMVEHPVHVPIAVGTGIEVVEILDEPERQ